MDIVVLDRGLPDADGLDVLTEMRRRARHDPGADPDRAWQPQGPRHRAGSGADDYLVKPFALEELVARLQALLRRPGNLLGVAAASSAI